MLFDKSNRSNKSNKKIMEEMLIIPYYEVYIEPIIDGLLKSVNENGDTDQKKIVNTLIFEVNTLPELEYMACIEALYLNVKKPEIKKFFPEYFKIMNGKLDEHHRLAQHLVKFDEKPLLSELNDLIKRCLENKLQNKSTQNSSASPTARSPRAT